jgi:hypothetical protein
VSCCDWQTFEESLLHAFACQAVPCILIDWKRARRDWKRHHCTGSEAASMQIRDLRMDGEYNRPEWGIIKRNSP